MSAIGLSSLFFLKLPAGVLAHLLVIPYDAAWRGIFRTCAILSAALLVGRLAVLGLAAGATTLEVGLTATALGLAVFYAAAVRRDSPAVVRTTLLLGAVGVLGATLWLATRAELLAPPRPGRPPLLEWSRVALFPLESLSAAVLGAAVTAMLLGHFYLVAPSLPIRPLVRLSAILIGEVHLRLGLSALALWAGRGRLLPPDGSDALDFVVNLGVFVAPRVLVGLFFPAVFAWLVWRTARIRSTQSATGILYVVVVFLIIGEMMAAGCRAITGVPI